MSYLFNTLAIREILFESEIDEQQDKALFKVMQRSIDSDTLATKTDIQSLQQHIAHAVDKSESRLERSLTKQTIRYGSMLIVGASVLTAVLKFL